MLSAAIPHSIRTALLEDPRHFEDCLDRVLVRHRGESRLFPVLFKLLAHLDLSEEQARQLYVEIRQHQSVQAESQNRHVDFRVAMMDYLVSVKPHFVFPKVIELKEYEHQQDLAIRDGLTGLYNRRYLDALIVQEIHRARRHKSHFALLFIDIDDFKRINDSHGHQKGDFVLCALAELLSNAARAGDTVARYGGEEFVCLLTETGKDGGRSCAARIMRSIKDLGYRELPRFTVSMGLASYPEDGTEAEQIMNAADKRLYTAKAEGKNRLVDR